jgi:hypothetical protein
VADRYADKVGMTGGSHGEKVMYAAGAEFVEVRIHALTQEIRGPRIVGAFAAGRLMNTRTAHSQFTGGMTWGISSCSNRQPPSAAAGDTTIAVVVEARAGLHLTNPARLCLTAREGRPVRDGPTAARSAE